MTQDLVLIPNNYQQSLKIFEKEKAKLHGALVNLNVDIQHIGSTAIPKTIGKGIIDILLICKNEVDQLLIKDKLVELGYKQGELNKIPDGRLFFDNFEGQTHAGDIHLHLVIKDDIKNLVSLKFRDYLLQHPEEVEQYNNEKTRLANTTNNNRHDYAVQKESFIKQVMKKIE